jgi:hypothetical protein
MLRGLRLCITGSVLFGSVEFTEVVLLATGVESITGVELATGDGSE